MHGQSVAAVESALRASLTPSVERCVTWKWSPGFETLTDYRITSPCRDRTALGAAIGIHERSMHSAPETALLKEMGALKLLTSSRKMDLEEMKASLKLYARKMTAFPADLAVAAIRSQPTRSPWWPAWKDLLDEMEPPTRDRRLRLQALYELRDAPPTLKAVTEAPLSQAERAAVIKRAHERAEASE